jgi:hypothetical protein
MGLERLKVVIAVVVVTVLISAVGVSLLRVRVFPAPAKPHTALGHMMCGLAVKHLVSQNTVSNSWQRYLTRENPLVRDRHPA